ncbi:MAG: hypothetical protein Q3M24_14785 [Candidatus Electrothrix aestuarii]|uniref:Uncharacterized protein n=1 Tax=Candidatus Electrothrix aestuarii TaxID=3062594 RepID=A0AAU8LRQ3_9BACT|nr:hypothetical protein [Candidatus Electrothrix aestuarii]
MKEQIIAAADSPHELEALYRAQPKEFTQALPDVLAEQSDAITLQVGMNACSSRKEKMRRCHPPDGAQVTYGGRLFCLSLLAPWSSFPSFFQLWMMTGFTVVISEQLSSAP